MSSSSLRTVITDDDLGDAGWRELHLLARQRRRSPRAQALVLLRYALCQSLAGHDVELSQTRLAALLAEENAA